MTVTVPRQTFSIRLTPAELAQVDAIATAEGRSRSDVMRRLMSEALQARGKRK